jgi:hypothetical protein
MPRFVDEKMSLIIRARIVELYDRHGLASLPAGHHHIGINGHPVT